MEDPHKVTVQACYINGQLCRNGRRDDFPINPETGVRYVCNKWVKLVGRLADSPEWVDIWMCKEQADCELTKEHNKLIHQGNAQMDQVRNEVSGLRNTPIVIQIPPRKINELEVIEEKNGKDG